MILAEYYLCNKKSLNSRAVQAINQRTTGPENAHLKPDLGALMTLILNTHILLLTSLVVCICQVSGLRLQ